MVFDTIKRALAGDDPGRLDSIQQELERITEAIGQRADDLDQKRASRLQALFPDGPVEGSGKGSYPGLDPVNFEDGEGQGWLVSAATGIIDNFPGSEALLSQLDTTLLAFADANYYRVVEGGPYESLLTWTKEILACWDLDVSAPIYVCNGKGTKVLGCKAPIVVVDRATLDGLEDEEEQRFLLAACLGHLFFGNLRIFAFHRLMGILDKLPSMTSVVTRGLGMIPMIGNTISRGFDLARMLNNQVIRKTNLVIGQRQHVLCDRLACMALGSREPALRYFAKTALGGDHALTEGVRERLFGQGAELQKRYDAGEIDLNMLSVVGPSDPFAAWRAFKLDQWVNEERSQKIYAGYYVTRERLEEHRKTDKKIEDEIRFLEDRLVDLHKKQGKLREELQTLLAKRAAADEAASE